MASATAKAPTSKIEHELAEATGIELKDGEKRSKYLGRLVRAANDLEEGDWGKLSEGAQKWVNTGIEALNDKNEVQDFADKGSAKMAKKSSKKAVVEDADEDEEEAEDDEESEDEEDEDSDAEESEDEDEEETEDDEDEDEEEAPVAKSTRIKSRAKTPVEDADEDEDAKPAKKEKSARKPGATAALKELVCKNPKKDREWLKAKLEEKGYAIGDNTLNIVFYDVHGTLNILQRLDKLKDMDLAPSKKKGD